MNAGIPLLDHEREQIEVADLGLGNLDETGLQIITLAADPWVAVKLLVLTPGQFFPQHRHPPGTRHWFQAGKEGAVFWSISSKATDAVDEFSDPDVVRMA